VDQNHIGVVTLNSETDYAARGWLETVPNPAVAVRTDGKIAAVNARAAALFGYTHDDLVGQPVDAIVSAGLTGVGLRRDGSAFPVAVALTSLPETSSLVAPVATGPAAVGPAAVGPAATASATLATEAPAAAPQPPVSASTASPATPASAVPGAPASAVPGAPASVASPAPPSVASAAPVSVASAAAADADPAVASVPAAASVRAVPAPGVPASAEGTPAAGSAARSAAEGRTGPSAVPAISRPEDLGHLAGAVAHDVNNLLSVIRNYAAFVADALEAAAEADRAARDAASIGETASAAASAGVTGDACADAAASAGGPARPEQFPGAAGPVDWAQMRHDMAQIQHAGERAAELTAELLAAVRRKAADAQAVDLRAVVSDTAGLLRRPLGERIDVRVELADDLWQVCSDPARLEQAIINLAMNARDAMPHGGTLTMTAGNVVLGDPAVPARPSAGIDPSAGTGSSAGTETSGSVTSGGVGASSGSAAVGGVDPAEGEPRRRFVSLQVTDTGIGMSLATQARAFEPFFTTKPEGAGTGLGLAVVRDVVAQAGGEAWISSTVHVGTTVGLLLPACDPAAPSRSATAARTTAPDTASAPAAAVVAPGATTATATVPAPAAPMASAPAPARPAPTDPAPTDPAPTDPTSPDGPWICHRRPDGPPSRAPGARRVRLPAPTPTAVS